MSVLVAALLCVAQSPAPPAAIAKLATQANAARDASRLPEAAALYRQAVAIAPRWTEGWWSLGTIEYERERFAEARDALRRYVALDAASGAGFALLGLSEYRTNQWPAALEHLERAMTLGLPPAEQLSSVARYHTMLLQNRAGNFERTLQLATLEAQQPAVAPEVVAVVGLAGLRRTQAPSEIAVDDREVIFKTGRAILFAAERRSAEARELLEEVLTLYPRVPNVNFVFASFLLANEADRGVELLRAELALNGRHLPALVSLAGEYLKRGEPKAALPLAKTAVEVAPANFPARTMLGRTLTELGDAEGAVRELLLAAKLEPNSPQVRFSLAAAYAKAGRAADAKRERDEFVRLKKTLESGPGAQTP